MKFKIGDKVKIKEEGFFESDYMVGRVGKIIDTDSAGDDYDFLVKTPTGSDWYKASQLELVKEKSHTHTISTLEFSSLDEVKKQLQEWVDEGKLKEGTKVFEIKKEIPFETKTEIKI